MVRLVADGVVWQGRLVGPAVWAGAQAETPAEDDAFRDSVTHETGDTLADAGEFIHLLTASFLAGGRWQRAEGVRMAIGSVSAWWQHRGED